MGFLLMGLTASLLFSFPDWPAPHTIYYERCSNGEEKVSREVAAIDRALEQLEYQRLLYRSRALWESDKGMRLQNRKGFNLEARRAFKEAELYWEAVNMIEGRIATLRQRREALVKKGEG